MEEEKKEQLECPTVRIALYTGPKWDTGRPGQVPLQTDIL